MQARLPIGLENFERIRTEGFYYVDKTGFIRELLQNMAYVNLFTRPRRFGKTLNMSMLKYFLKQAVTLRFLRSSRFQGKRTFAWSIWENFRSYPSR